MALKGRAEAIYVAEVDSVVCGFLLLKTRNCADNTTIGTIDLIAVDPNCKGQGLGAALDWTSFTSLSWTG